MNHVLLSTQNCDSSPETRVLFYYFQAADEARRWGTQLFVIGVGNNINIDELRTIASDPDNEFLYRVEDFNQLESLRDTLLMRLCQLVGK